MRERRQKPNLVLVRGGSSSMGPISRMGLWGRFPQPQPAYRYLWIAGKVALLASLLYYLLA